MTKTATAPTSSPTTTLSPRPDQPTITDTAQRPTEHRSHRVPFLVVGVLALAAVGVAVGALVSYRSAPGVGISAPALTSGTTVATTHTIGDTAHGGPGSWADVVRADTTAAAVTPQATGDVVSHGGPGSRTDSVRRPAPRHAIDVRIADVAHGTAGFVVTAVAAHD
jgi:hypothetical protein